jgi:hypothetical protein
MFGASYLLHFCVAAHPLSGLLLHVADPPACLRAGVLLLLLLLFSFSPLLQSLIDWGVQVMECFKADVATLSVNDAAGTSKPNKESTEYAIVALIRSFSAQADTFRSYLQAGPDARATAGLTGLKVLSQQVRMQLFEHGVAVV